MSTKINPALSTLVRPIDSLHTDPKNARKHGKRDLEVLARSLSEHGQQKPIVALQNGTVIAGNGTLEAARSLGWAEIAVVLFDSEDEARARAFAIVDNRSAELSEWDDAVLSDALSALEPASLESIGFNADETVAILASVGGGSEVQIPSGVVEPPLPAPPSSGGIPAESTSHVRMVQLFLNDQNHEPFMVKVKQLAVHFGVDNVTDACVRAVEDAHARALGK